MFAAYIALKKAGEKFPAEYRFVKNKKLGIFLGGWCFFVTAASCILGIYSEDKFKLIMNIVTPLVLLGLGLIMPRLARRERERSN